MIEFIVMGFKYPKNEIIRCQQKIADLQNKFVLDLKQNQYRNIHKNILRILRQKEACILAIHRVRTNRGYRSPGLSKQFLNTKEDFESMTQWLWKIVKHPFQYKSDPLQRIDIPKPGRNETRPLSIPSYKDRCLQALWYLAIEPIAEHQADEHSYGFRRLRSPSMAGALIMELLRLEKRRITHILELDIKKCFDTIDHDYILKNIPIHQQILQEWLNCGYIPVKDTITHPTSSGVPQGGIISPVICNMVIDGLSKEVHNILGSLNLSTKGVVTIRFADDIIITGPSKEILQAALKATADFLSVRGLEIKQQKTRIVNLNLGESFIFLGYEYFRISSLKSFWRCPKDKVQDVIQRCNKAAYSTKSFGEAIQKVNSILVGWYNYYRMTNSSRQIRRVSNSVWYILYERARAYVMNRPEISKYSKNSRNKIRKIITKEYMIRKKSPKGPSYQVTFFGYRIYLSGKRVPQYLINISYGTLRHRFSYRSGLNACDFQDSLQLEKVNLYNRSPSTYQKVLLKTCGLCKKCQRVLDGNRGYEINHKLPRMFGGKNDLSNLIPLCKECHREINNTISRAIALPRVDPIVLGKIRDYIEQSLIIFPESYKKKKNYD
uniref:Reverse transcriptase domain-containing protein n=1 Tax=Caulerpa racemosa TaxID=76317 RepID=A0A1I9LKB8_CAURA|nr:hypothetical protein [Caulerpa racemosa]ANJ70779.1 hypothetical protein [Caulerpa racemosa]